MAEHLKKPFGVSLGNIKERMKERRIQKLTMLGRVSLSSAAKRKLPTVRSKQMKSIQANNRALARALQEGKLQLKDAQDTIFQLRKDYHDLKCQMLDLQRNRFKQEQGLENQLLALKAIISKVSQNLLDSVELLGSAKNLCSIGAGQRVLSSVLENTSSAIGQICSVAFLQCTDGVARVFPGGMEADSGKSELTHSTSEPDSATSLIVPDEGQASGFHLVNTGSEMENLFSSGKDEFGIVLPKGVSTRRRCSDVRLFDGLCPGILDHLRVPESIEELPNEDETRLEESLDECTVENINSDISPLNENKAGSELLLKQIDSETAQFTFNGNSDLEQHQRKSREVSQVRKEKHQKVKQEWPKNTSRQRPKKGVVKEAPKENSDFLGGSSDAYDFDFEERVHVTPFRQNKTNDADTGVDDKEDLPETNTLESSDTEEDLDDSLYEPYKSKSKKKKSPGDKKDTSPVPARPRSKRCLAQREQKLHSQEETKSNTSSDKSDRQPSEPSRGHLRDVTNTTSSLPSTGDAPAVPEGEGPPSPKRKRSRPLSVSWNARSFPR